MSALKRKVRWGTISAMFVLIAGCQNVESTGVSLQALDRDSANAAIPARDFAPQISPNGMQLVYYSYRAERTPDIYVFDLNTFEERRLTATPKVWEIEPDWFGGNEVISFPAGNSMRELQTHLMNVSDGEVTKYGQQRDNIGPANPLADGSGFVTFLKKSDVEYQLAIFDDGPHLAIVSIELPPGKSASPKPSPDGRYILFHVTHQQRRDLYVADLEDGDLWRITDNEIEEEYLNWSQDGNWVLYSANSGEQPRRIYGIRIDADARVAGKPVQLTHGPSDQAHVFSSMSADGEWLYFDANLSRDSRIFRQSMRNLDQPPEQLTGVK
ncbi:hypothetical protein [Parvularcula marina]|uniref:hypothetical protein n=1 Tax=Parvularcula marina TaxID=2292771 RepID=UPI0035137625